MTAFEKLGGLIKKLEAGRVPFDLKHVRDGYIMIAVASPGKRWEIEISAAGEVEIEIFTSDGEILEESSLDQLWKDLR